MTNVKFSTVKLPLKWQVLAGMWQAWLLGKLDSTVSAFLSLQKEFY